MAEGIREIVRARELHARAVRGDIPDDEVREAIVLMDRLIAAERLMWATTACNVVAVVYRRRRKNRSATGFFRSQYLSARDRLRRAWNRSMMR